MPFSTPSTTTTELLLLPLQAELSRRDAVAFGLATAFIAGGASPSLAATTAGAPTQAELNRIKQGYEGLVYLLDNFEQETTVCRENGGECKRDADAVRKYLGIAIDSRSPVSD